MHQVDFARHLRQESTDAERLVWSRLRAGRLLGFKFRRQQPIGRFVVDFVCFARRLIVELDGGQHADSPSDEIRTTWLVDQGFQVLRFWNHDVLNETEACLERIRQSLED